MGIENSQIFGKEFYLRALRRYSTEVDINNMSEWVHTLYIEASTVDQFIPDRLLSENRPKVFCGYHHFTKRNPTDGALRLVCINEDFEQFEVYVNMPAAESHFYFHGCIINALFDSVTDQPVSWIFTGYRATVNAYIPSATQDFQVNFVFNESPLDGSFELSQVAGDALKELGTSFAIGVPALYNAETLRLSVLLPVISGVFGDDYDFDCDNLQIFSNADDGTNYLLVVENIAPFAVGTIIAEIFRLVMPMTIISASAGFSITAVQYDGSPVTVLTGALPVDDSSATAYGDNTQGTLSVTVSIPDPSEASLLLRVNGDVFEEKIINSNGVYDFLDVPENATLLLTIQSTT